MNTIQPLLTIVLTLLAFLAPQLITLYFSTKRKAEADKDYIDGLSQPAE